jgi:hypothetical protein
MRPTFQKIAIAAATATSITATTAVIPNSAHAQHRFYLRDWYRGYWFHSELPWGHYYGYPPYPYDYGYGLPYKYESDGDYMSNCLWRRRQSVPDFKDHLVWRRRGPCN